MLNSSTIDKVGGRFVSRITTSNLKFEQYFGFLRSINRQLHFLSQEKLRKFNEKLDTARKERLEERRKKRIQDRKRAYKEEKEEARKKALEEQKRKGAVETENFPVNPF